jgi:glutamyl-tRNA reductase
MRVVKKDIHQHRAAANEANKIVAHEVLGFPPQAHGGAGDPDCSRPAPATRRALPAGSRAYREEYGPFTEDQDQILTTLAARITQRIAGSLARELRDLPDRAGQDMLTVALHRLFQLESSNMITAVQEN